MLKILAIGALALAAASVSAQAQPSSQQSRMASCNKEAVGKKGDERKAFMKQCLSSKGTAPAAAAKPAR